MNIKNILFKKIDRALPFGIFLIFWGPFLMYFDYKNTYLYCMYVDYSSYFEYFRAKSFLLIGFLFIPIILGICLIINNKKKVLREFIEIISIIVLLVSTFIIIFWGPGLGESIYVRQHLDEENSIIISRAISTFIANSYCSDFNDLYDSTNKNQLNIKQNDPESVKLLITALQDKIYYKNESFGPYLEKKLNGYDSWKPRSTKKAIGYRIEISDGGVSVKCVPVFIKSEAVIIIK